MFPSLGGPEMIAVLVLAVLLFGKRLPEVGRSLGKGIIEFKKGIRGIEDELDRATTTAPVRHEDYSQRTVDPAVPKFEPPGALAKPTSPVYPD